VAGPPLWVVERGDARVYLFGVRPVFDDADWLTPSVEAALDKSSSFWRETPPTEELASSPLIAEHGLSPGVELRSRLDDETNRRFEAVAMGAGVEPDTLQAFRPWLALQVLRHAVYEQIWSGPTMDDTLTEIALRDGMTIGYEFDVEAIARFFGEMPEAVEIDLLKMALDELEPGSEGIVDRYRRGIAGDLAFEEADAVRISTAYPELYRRLLTERNRAWVPKIDEALAKGETTFIAPGTMHLVGPDNVRSLLRDPVRTIG
jgi:uncharacterized protein